MNSPIVTGTSVTRQQARRRHGERLGERQRLEQSSLLALSVNTGRKHTVMMSSEKNSAGPTSFDDLDDDLPALAPA